MSIFLRPQKVCHDCNQKWYPAEDIDLTTCPNCRSTHISNEKISLYGTFLFYSAGLIALGLIIISWETSELPPAIEPFSEVAESLTKSEQQVQLPSIEDELNINSDTDEAPAVIAQAPKEQLDQTIKLIETIPPAQPVVEPAPEQQEEIATVEEPRPETNISKEIVAFSIWSISEQRLRTIYTKLMNDGSSSTELRKRDYLQFVNSRNKRCGEINSEFAKNINDGDKVTFKDGDFNILECHSSENTTEFNRLKAAGYDD